MELKDMEKIHHFTHHQYVIKMMDSNDWLRHYNEGEEVVNDFILPRGPKQKDEFSDTIYHQGTIVPYHWHRKGFETFEIAKGSVDCVVNGKHFIATEGDIIHLPPYTSHGFKFLEEETIWRELFQEIDMSGGIFEKNMVNAYYSSMKEDVEFMAMYREEKTISREIPVVWNEKPMDHSLVHQCRTPEFAWKTHQGKGYSLQLKVGKWETDGAKEIWLANVNKGLCVEFRYPHAGFDLYYVKSGKLELTIDHTMENESPTTFIVEGDSIIDIPPYHTYTINVLENAKIYNYGGEYDLMNCLEDLEALKQNNSEILNDEKQYLKYLRKYKVYATKLTHED